MVALKAGWLEALGDGKPKTASDIADVVGGEVELIGKLIESFEQRQFTFLQLAS